VSDRSSDADRCPAATDDPRVELDGEPRPVWALTGAEPPRRRDVVVTAPTELRYEFTATAGIERATPGAGPPDAGNSAIVSRADDGTWTARGTIGDGACETFTVYGAVTSFEPRYGDFSVLADGTPVSPRTLVDTDSSLAAAALLGGGDDYPEAVRTRQATVTARTAAELTSALDSATPGDVVFVAGEADIDVSTAELRVPNGVTLASNRGVDAAPGGLLYTTTATWPMLTVGDDARVTGLRLGGPHNTFVAYDSDRVGLGLDVVGAGVEIDNCELFGFASAAVRCGADTRVRHSHIHHIPMELVGTAVRCTDGHPQIRYNYVNYTRDGVAATGNGGYTVADNRFGAGVLGHALVCDPPGGTTLEIHHNTVTVTDDGTGSTTAIALRGEPTDRATIANNWFRTEQTSTGASNGNATGAITHPVTGSWQTVEFVDNRYGTREPADHIGHPR
jgi:hypothetical protein